MTQVDFYVLELANQVEAQHNFACRIADKALSQGNNIFIATNSPEDSAQFDTTLWTFRPESFLPHCLVNDDCASHAPIVISHDENDLEHHDVLINLRQSVPKQFSRFERLVEIVIQEDASLALSRKNFAFYKNRGYPIQTHKLKI